MGGSGTSNPRWPPSGGALPALNNDRKGLGPHPAHQFTAERPVASFHCSLPGLRGGDRKGPDLEPSPPSPYQFSLRLLFQKPLFRSPCKNE